MLRIPLAILIAALLSRAVGPEGVGQWAMVIAVGVFFHALFLGWTQAQAVRIGRVEWLNHGALSRTWAARWPFVASGLVVAAILLAVQPLSFFERTTQLPVSWWPIALAYLLGTWCVSEAQISMQTTGRFTYLALFPLAQDMASIGLLLYVLAWAPDLGTVRILSGIAALTLVFGGAVWVGEFVSTRSWGGRASSKDVRQIAIYGGPVALAAMMGFLSDWGDHFLLQHFHGPDQVGLFQVGYQAMMAMMALAVPVGLIFLPKLVDQSRHDPRAEEDYVRGTVPAVITFWLLALVPCIAVVPSLFLLVFGPKFHAAQPLLLVLSIAVPGAIFSYVYSVLFNTQGRSVRPALYVGAMAIINLLVSFALVPRMGALGAAAGTAVSYVLVQALYMADQHRHLSMPMGASGGLFLLAIAYGVLQWVAGDGLLIRLGLAIVFISVLVAISRRFRLTRAVVVRQLLPPGLSRVGAFFDRLLSGDRPVGRTVDSRQSAP